MVKPHTELPLTGLIIHSDDSNSDSEHSHHLYITTWDGQPLPIHIHPFSGVTSFDAGHDHHYAGTTETAPSGVSLYP
jgi:hypothetical protein